MKRAIFAITSKTDMEYEEWVKLLEKTLTDPLGNLIDRLGRDMRESSTFSDGNLAGLLRELRKAQVIRNVLCHACWNKTPDASGASVPRSFAKPLEMFDSKIDISYLKKTQAGVAELGISVMNIVTSAGYRFPGSKGPGTPVW